MDKSQGDDTRSQDAKRLIDGIDALLCCLILVACAGLYYVTTTFDEPSALLGQNVLPSDFPQTLLILIGLLALLLPFEHRFEVSRWPKIQKSRGEPIANLTWATMALLIALTAGAPYAGTMLTIFLVSFFMPLLWGERRLVRVVLFSVIFTAAVTYVFAILLRVHFEPGLPGISLV